MTHLIRVSESNAHTTVTYHNAAGFENAKQVAKDALAGCVKGEGWVRIDRLKSGDEEAEDGSNVEYNVLTLRA